MNNDHAKIEFQKDLETILSILRQRARYQELQAKEGGSREKDKHAYCASVLGRIIDEIESEES